MESNGEERSFQKALGASILHKYCGAVHWKHSCIHESGHVCLDKGENVHACANFNCTYVCVCVCKVMHVCM